MPAALCDNFTDDELEAALTAGGSLGGGARVLGVPRQAFTRAVNRRGILARSPPTTQRMNAERSLGERPSIQIIGDDCTFISEAAPEQLGDVHDMLRERGLDPEDWIITALTVNKWNAMTSAAKPGENLIVEMKQLKVVLKRRISMTLVSPAVHVPRLKRSKVARLARRDGPAYTLVEGDNQAPYHDRALDSALVALLTWLQPENHIFLGDTLDFPTISKYMDHPAVTAAVQDCINAGYDILRSRADASPETTRKKLKGNHDWRIESEQLLRSERMYGVSPAHEVMAALDIRRLLHLETLGIELVTDIRGWEHAEIELVPGPKGLVASHGWMTGQNTAERSMKQRGRSQIVGHTHRRELTYWWDPSMEVERIGATVGCMCETRGGGDGRYPHYVKQDRWLQGAAIVAIWPDDRFEIEHVRWDGHTLTWRGERFTP